MIHFAPLLPEPAIVAILLLLPVLIILLYRSYRPVVSRSYWWLLVLTKLLALAAIIFAILNPYVIQRQPDTSTSKVVFVIDATGSMSTTDCRGQERLQVVKEQIMSPASLFHANVIAATSHARFLLFAGDELHRVEPGMDFTVLPGESDIDSALKTVLNSPMEGLETAAVVLITDGVDNRGMPLTDAGKYFKNARIPVHCIGVGDTQSQRDVSVSWLNRDQTATKNEPLDLVARIERNFTGNLDAKMTITENGRIIDQRDLHFAPTTARLEEKLAHIPFTAGFKNYKVQITAVANEETMLNNTDYLGVKVKEPDVFKLLYFTANLGWDYKFIKRFSDEEDMLTLDAIIRLGDQTWLVEAAKTDSALSTGFPDCTLVNGYDGLIVDLNSFQVMKPEHIKCLYNFVAERGGGIIFTGVTEAAPEAIGNLLPVVGLPPNGVKTGRTPLNLVSSRIFANTDSQLVEALKYKLYAPAGAEVYAVGKDKVKPGGIVVLTGGKSGWIALAAQYFGAGKVAWLNLPDTWQWVMDSDDGRRYHDFFWGQLISWTASGGKERLTVSPAAAKFPLDQEQECRVDVLDENYIPDNHAQVLASIIGPQGAEQSLAFAPDPRVDGRYVAKFVPRQTGEYKFTIQARSRGNKNQEIIAEYIIVDPSLESEPHPLAEDVLRGLARQTNGSYWNYRDIASIRNLNYSEKIRFRETNVYLLNYWWSLLLVVLAALLDWFLRRRIGLR